VLLGEIGASLKAAAAASASSGAAALGRFNFAHCETLTPLLTLMGLFQSDLEAPAGGAEAEEAAAGTRSSLRQGREDLLGPPVDSILDDAQLVVARRLAGSGAAAAAAERTSGGGSSGWGGGGSGEGSESSSGTAAGGLSGGDEDMLEAGSIGISSRAFDSLDSDGGSSTASSGSGGGHKHGPKAVGCVFKGRAIPGGPLPPPPGWRPRIGPPGADGREWRGGRVAPLGANLVFILYRRRGGPAGKGDPARPAFLVRVAHNEQVLALPQLQMCQGGGGGGLGSPGGGALDCDLEDFLGSVVAGRAASAAQLLRLCDASGGGGGGGGVEGLPLFTADGRQLDGELL
jgi:hypothetical protein